MAQLSPQATAVYFPHWNRDTWRLSPVRSADLAFMHAASWLSPRVLYIFPEGNDSTCFLVITDMTPLRFPDCLHTVISMVWEYSVMSVKAQPRFLPPTSISVSKLPSSYKDTSHWIRTHCSDLILTGCVCKDLLPSKVTLTASSWAQGSEGHYSTTVASLGKYEEMKRCVIRKGL